MPKERLSMRKIRDVLRYRHSTGLSLEAIARALNLSKGVVAKYLRLAGLAGLGWPLPEDLDDVALEKRLYQQPSSRVATFAEPDYAKIHQELKRKGVTLLLLWEEYQASQGDRAFQYTAFCTHYHAWRGMLKRSMRQIHRAGEKLFADYAGPTMAIIDADSGEVGQASIFVAVLGASSYTFACATAAQKQTDWLSGLARALGFIGGVPQIIVPDNPRALIAKANRYEPEATRGTIEFAAHYGTVILPARPRKPQDKAKVEVGVQVSTELVDGAATVAINVKALKSNPRIVLLAYSGAKRATSLPELPTVAEAGVPMYAFETWTGLLAPAGTPKPEMEKINRAMAVVSTTPVVLDRLHELGAEFSITSMEAFQEFLRVDWQRTGVQVRAAGAMLN